MDVISEYRLCSGHADVLWELMTDIQFNVLDGSLPHLPKDIILMLGFSQVGLAVWYCEHKN